MDLQGSLSKKEERGVRGSMKSSWQEPRMILWLCKKITMAIKSALSFLEEKEGKKREVKGWITG